jgi:hypothetical protein
MKLPSGTKSQVTFHTIIKTCKLVFLNDGREKICSFDIITKIFSLYGTPKKTLRPLRLTYTNIKIKIYEKSHLFADLFGHLDALLPRHRLALLDRQGPAALDGYGLAALHRHLLAVLHILADLYGGLGALLLGDLMAQIFILFVFLEEFLDELPCKEEELEYRHCSILFPGLINGCNLHLLLNHKYSSLKSQALADVLCIKTLQQSDKNKEKTSVGRWGSGSGSFWASRIRIWIH